MVFVLSFPHLNPSPQGHKKMPLLFGGRIQIGKTQLHSLRALESLEQRSVKRKPGDCGLLSLTIEHSKSQELSETKTPKRRPEGVNLVLS